jgi:poly-gamma-glutamate system protein
MTEGPRRPVTLFLTLAGLAGLAYAVLLNTLPAADPAVRTEMVTASRLMARAEAAIGECRRERGLGLDRKADPNGTGLIGLEMSPTTTTLGNLGAKRTTTNPNTAGLVAFLVHEAGARRGDLVAVGASGSFPALVLATLAALKAIGLKPLLIVSLGASEWGANDPAFTWLDMAACLRDRGIIDTRPLAMAVGGDEDIGGGMTPEGRELLAGRIKATGVTFLEEPSLEVNVQARLRIYEAAADGRPVKAFVNIGGSWANIGTNSEVLKLAPGLDRRVPVPPREGRGVLQAMAARGVPVIHLLNVRGLAARYGLPWDPKPLPRPGEGELYRLAGRRRVLVLLLSAGTIAVVVLLALMLRRRDPSGI